MPSDIATNNALILTLINRMDSLEATINNAVTVAVATALQASEARVARNEERITQLVQQLDETNHKFDAKYNQLERQFDTCARACVVTTPWPTGQPRTKKSAMERPHRKHSVRHGPEK